MAADQTTEWPQFKLVTYAAPTGIPHGWDAELLEQGAPDGLGCTALPALILLTHPDIGPLVCFGLGHLVDLYVCMNPHTKQVVDIHAHGPIASDDTQPEMIGPALPVNSSLGQFIASVRAVTERFPYDSEVTGKGRRDEEDEETRDERRFNEWSEAVLQMADMLDRIDPTAYTLGGDYWGIFLGDVSMGNYASETWRNPPDA